MKKITFTAIKFENHAIMWDYYPENNEAHCTFFLSNSKKLAEKEIILEQLKTIPGITITANQEAIITDTTSFFKTNPPSYPLNLLALKASIPFTSADSFFKNKNREKRISTSRTISLATTLVSTPHRASTDPACEKKYTHGIYLDALIPNTEKTKSLWAETISHENYFLNKTLNDAKNRSYKTIKSLIVLAKEFQYEDNKTLYPIRTEMMIVIRHFFDQLLAPAYDKLRADEETSPALVEFWRDVIENVIVKTQHDFALSKLEKTKDKLFGTFLASMSENQGRLAHAHSILKPFLFFISDDIKIKKLTTDPHLAKLLLQLKAATHPITQEITDDINNLQKLLVIRAEKTSQRHKERKKMNDDIAKHAPEINHFMSFYYLIRLVLQSERPLILKDSKLEELVDTIVANAITVISKSFIDTNVTIGQIANVRSGESDFYISQELFARLKVQIGQMLSTFEPFKKMEHDKNQENSQNEYYEKLITAITAEMKTNIALHLEELTRQDHETENTLIEGGHTPRFIFNVTSIM